MELDELIRMADEFEITLGLPDYYGKLSTFRAVEVALEAVEKLP